MGSLIASWDYADNYSYYAGAKIGMTFPVPAGIDRIDKISLRLIRVGTVSGDITVSIYATSGGVPTGSALGSATLTASSVGGGSSYYDFTFASPITVTAGAKYAIVKQDNSSNSSNCIGWWRSGSPTYADGQGFYYVSSWVDWGRDFSFKAYGYLSALPPTVTTGASSSVLETQFDMAGNVTSDGGSTVTERGFVYSKTNPIPTTSDGKKTTTGTTGAMSATITGVDGGSLYYVRAYATNAMGTGYGAVVEVTTDTNAPTVTTDSLADVSATTMTGNGTVTSEHGATVTQRGICWNTGGSPTIADSKSVASSGGLGAFSVPITGLTPNTTYKFRAFATNADGTSYGAELTQATKDIITNWGQQFTASVTGTLTKVSLYLKLNQGTSGTVTLKIYSDSADVPNTLLYTTTKVITNTSYAFVDINVSVAITNTSKYWVVVESPYVVGSFEIYIGANGAGAYGLCKYTKSSAPSTWTAKATTTWAIKLYQQPSISLNTNIVARYKKRYR